MPFASTLRPPRQRRSPYPLSPGIDASEDFTDTWKVLVYDQDCRDIISPLMNIGALRAKGVTLHMLLHTDREPVQDAPAVYFVRPTEANVKRIAEDCAKQLYRSFNLHFVTRIERPLLERLAQDLAASNSVALVSKVFDQYLDVIALEPSMFTLNVQDSLVAYNDPSLGEAQIRAFMARVSAGLLSMVRVLGAMPIIRAPVGGAAHMLAQELCNTLTENISPRGPAQGLFSDCLVSDRPRPLLLIFDRSSDMVPPLMHTSTYQALVDDLLDHRLNRVTVDLPGKDNAPGKKKTYDMNTQSDHFFARYAGAPFPEAVEANEKELAEVSQREAEIRSKPAQDLSGLGAAAGGGGKDLSEAIESLPEILSKKANLEAHTNVLQAVMKSIAAREVPTYFETEQSIITAGRVTDRAAVLSLLKDGTKGRLADKARLLALAAVVGEGGVMSKAANEEYDAAFVTGCTAMAGAAALSAAPSSSSAGAAPAAPTKDDVDRTLAAVAFVRRMQALQSPMSSAASSVFKASGNAPPAAMLSSFLTSAQVRAALILGLGLGRVVALVVALVRALVVRGHGRATSPSRRRRRPSHAFLPLFPFPSCVAEPSVHPYGQSRLLLHQIRTHVREPRRGRALRGQGLPGRRRLLHPRPAGPRGPPGAQGTAWRWWRP